jgi:antitoxin (DNA-binding transcriptional repressor) of toxin-antitoxin stability system
MNAPTKTITATEAARNFSDMLNRVHYRGERFNIARGGEIVARVEPASPKRMTVGELRELLDSLPPLSQEEADAWAEDLKAIRESAPLPPSPWD